MSKDIFADGDPFEDPHSRKTPKAKRSSRLIGCPLPWFAWILPLVKSKDQLAMALYLYRRCSICNSDTITVPNDEVSALLDISRWGKYRQLTALERAGILRIKSASRWRLAKVQLCHWPEPPSQ
jgi:hypothetical protein